MAVELPWLFLEPDRGLDHCPGIILSCFGARTSVDNWEMKLLSPLPPPYIITHGKFRRGSREGKDGGLGRCFGRTHPSTWAKNSGLLHNPRNIGSYEMGIVTYSIYFDVILLLYMLPSFTKAERQCIGRLLPLSGYATIGSHSWNPGQASLFVHPWIHMEMPKDHPYVSQPDFSAKKFQEQ